MKHRVVVTYEGYDFHKDALIEKTAGAPCRGSGYGFGVRDMDFTFPSAQAAQAAAARVKTIPGVTASLIT